MSDRRIIEELAELSASSFYPMHVPGHKRNIIRDNGLPYGIDVTELPSTDDLHHPRGLIKDAMDRAAELYGSEKTCFLVNGSTCGILAAIGCAVRRGGSIITARNSHISVFNAMRINQLKPGFIMPEICESLGICASITPERVREAIERTPAAEAVVITSPTYEGVISDIRSIAGICHSHGIPLIVDEAHGAHLKFFRAGGFSGESALDAGADLVIQSAHKTLPALTQSAFIHVGRESSIDMLRLSEQLSIYETSSPSYILMASLDEAVDILVKEGDMLFKRLSGNIVMLNEALSELKALRAFIFKRDEEGVYEKDPTRLMINTGSTGLDGEALAGLLRNEYGIETEIFDGVTISFTDAGHLMGSANVLFKLSEDGAEKTLLFSGDLGNIDKPLIKSPQDPPQADYVVCESTYGDREHPERPDYVAQLTQIIQSSLDKGGNLVVPAFAVGRTQELLYYIRIIKEKGLIKNHDGFPVIVDSPLAVEATNIYSSELQEYYDEEALELIQAGINPVTFPDLKVSTSSDESKAINDDRTPKVIISASGMCEAGRIRHHLKHNLWRPECTIMFVGYQSPGTVGGKLLDGADMVKLFGEEISVKAEIVRIDSFSSHADRTHLLEWIQKANPAARLFINHGEDEVVEKLAAEASALVGTPATAPYSGEVWDLATNELAHKATVVPVIKKQAAPEGAAGDSKAASAASPAYRDLEKAGNELMALIRRDRELSNKELKKIRKDIESLLEKYGN